jgi:hypothetical protein
MSTLTSVDLNIERSSTRLHAPPGGKTSICLGGNVEPVKQQVRRAPQNNIFSEDVAPVRSRPMPTNNIFGEEEAPRAVYTRPISKENESEGSMYQSTASAAGHGYNASMSKPQARAQMPREAAPQQAGESLFATMTQAPDRTSVRVRHAPGGQSSIVLG